MKVVLYLRYSSYKQDENSIEGQRSVCTEYCKRNNYQIVGEYIDRATSAKDNVKNRKDFLRMIEDSKNKNFEAVVVYKLDRFARNRLDSQIYKKKLQDNGVKLISASENLTDNIESVILESVLEGMNEYFSLELGQKTMRGMMEKAKQHKYLGCGVPFGFFVNSNNEYQIKEGELYLVNNMFDYYINGKSYTEIAKYLSKETNTKVDCSKVKRLLQNKMYIGCYSFANFTDPNVYPKIISEEKFYNVQKLIEKHKPKRSGRSDNYILDSKLTCGCCGERMLGKSVYNCKGEKYFYYYCKKCDFTINALKVNDIVFYGVGQSVTKDLLLKFSNTLAKEHNNKEGQIDKLKNDIAIKKRQETKLLNKFVETCNDIFANKANEISKEIKLLEIELNNLNNKTVEHTTKEDIFKYLEGLLYFKKDASNETKKAFIDTFVKEVVIDYNKKTREAIITIKYHFSKNFATTFVCGDMRRGANATKNNDMRVNIPPFTIPTQLIQFY